MNKISKRPPGLIAIVIYKAFTASLLAVTSIAILLALKNYQELAKFSESYALEGKLKIIKWLLERFIKLNPRTLEFSSIVAGVYAAMTVVEAIGLWYAKAWARVLVLILVGLSMPPEIFELIQKLSLLKLTIFLLNVAVFWYLLKGFPKLKK